MLPLTCPSASPVPGPFDLIAPHTLPWLVYPLLLTIPICLLGGLFKLIRDLQRGVQGSAHRWLSWLKGSADLCFRGMARIRPWDSHLDR